MIEDNQKHCVVCGCASCICGYPKPERIKPISARTMLEAAEKVEQLAEETLPDLSEREMQHALYREFSSGATRDLSNEKLDYEGFLSPLVLRRFAEYMHEKRKMPDGTLRSSDNWQKGIPKEEYVKSLIRHMMEVWLLMDGFSVTDEKQNQVDLQTALCALLFNVQGLLFEEVRSTF